MQMIRAAPSTMRRATRMPTVRLPLSVQKHTQKKMGSWRDCSTEYNICNSLYLCLPTLQICLILFNVVLSLQTNRSALETNVLRHLRFILPESKLRVGDILFCWNPQERWHNTIHDSYNKSATSCIWAAAVDSPANLMGPLSTLPPNPALSQNGGAQWASQWQFLLLLHTCSRWKQGAVRYYSHSSLIFNMQPLHSSSYSTVYRLPHVYGPGYRLDFTRDSPFDYQYYC